MLIVNKKYESLDKILKNESDEINEELSDDGIDSMTSFLKSPEASGLDDSKVDTYKSYLRSQSIQGIDKGKYDEFFADKNINYSDNVSDDFISLFSKYNQIGVLEKIVNSKTKGIINLSQLKKGNNIYDLVVTNWPDKKNKKGVREIVDKIRLYKKSGQPSEGQFEVCLRFILKGGGRKGSFGDVTVDNTRMEVKGCTVKTGAKMKESVEGGVLNQFIPVKEKFGVLSDDESVIYSSDKGKRIFAQRLNNYIDNKGKYKDIAKALVEGSAKMIGVKSIDSGVVSTVEALLRDGEDITAILGCIHLYYYSVSTSFNALIVINQDTGDYYYTDDFTNFRELMKHIKFASPTNGTAHKMSSIMWKRG